MIRVALLILIGLVLMIGPLDRTQYGQEDFTIADLKAMLGDRDIAIERLTRENAKLRGLVEACKETKDVPKTDPTNK